MYHIDNMLNENLNFNIFIHHDYGLRSSKSCPEPQDKTIDIFF